MPLLGTHRLLLQPFRHEEGNLFYSLNTNPFIREHLWGGLTISRGQAKDLLKQNKTLFSRQGLGFWKIVRQADEAVLGFTGLWFFFAHQHPQLVYALLESYTGNGYATESAQRILHYAFDELALPSVLATTDAGHAASEQVARRLGMRQHRTEMLEGKRTRFFFLRRQDFFARQVQT